MLETRRNERDGVYGKDQRVEPICSKSGGHRRNEDGPLRIGIKKESEIDNSRIYLCQSPRNVPEGHENSVHHK